MGDSTSMRPVTVQLINKPGQDVIVDDMSGDLKVIQRGHHEVHDGNVYSAYKGVTLGSTETLEIGFTTPATATPQKRIHLDPTFSTSGGGTFTILEGVASLAVGSGAAHTARNRNRGSSNTTSVTTLVTGSTGAAITFTGGTPIFVETIGGGQTVGGVSRGTEEWVLKPATSYVFRITSNGASNVCWLGLVWYEHNDAN